MACPKIAGMGIFIHELSERGAEHYCYFSVPLKHLCMNCAGIAVTNVINHAAAFILIVICLLKSSLG